MVRGVRQEPSEIAMIAAIEGNLCTQLRGMALSPEVELHDEPDLTWVISNIRYPPFNSVFCARLTPETAQARIRAVLRRFRTRRMPMTWWVGPASTPEDLGEQLKAASLVHTDDETGMALDLADLPAPDEPPEGLSIEGPPDPAGLAAWVIPIATTFGFPEPVSQAFLDGQSSVGFSEELPLHRYVARLGGTPVGSAMLFLGGGVAGIYWVCTIPEARGQGVGTALTQAALHDARDLGYALAVLQSTAKGQGMYRRLGFKEYCTFQHYIYVRGKMRRTLLRTHGRVNEAKGRRGKV